MVESLMLLIDQENNAPGDIYILARVEGCWDDHLKNALLEKVKDETLKPESIGRLLSTLLIHKSVEAETFAGSLIPVPLPTSEVEHSKAIVVAQALMTRAEDAGWSIVWPAIQQDTEFGKEVVTAVSHSELHAVSIGQRLAVAELADLYIWLERQYPHAEEIPSNTTEHTTLDLGKA